MSKLMITLLAAAGIAVAGSASAMNETMSPDAYKAEKGKIETQYHADREQCASMKGNARDVCSAEAKGKEKVAKADLEADYRKTDRARHEARIAKADADYAVAKEKCDDASGRAKETCVKDAKAAHAKAIADAKLARVDSSAHHGAALQKADAASHDTMKKAQPMPNEAAMKKADASTQPAR
jgi:hypothetical protein